MPSSAGVTQLLVKASDGDREAIDKLLPLVYDELRDLAGNYLRHERSDHTLQATALVHEAYLKLVDQKISWQNRAHFFSVAAQVMRHILVDHARHHKAEKRGGGELKLTLDEAVNFAASRNIDLLALDEALKHLVTLDPQLSQIVELRFFGGLDLNEIVEVMNVSNTTVNRKWRRAKALLHCHLFPDQMK